MPTVSKTKETYGTETIIHLADFLIQIRQCTNGLVCIQQETWKIKLFDAGIWDRGWINNEDPDP